MVKRHAIRPRPLPLRGGDAFAEEQLEQAGDLRPNHRIEPPAPGSLFGSTKPRILRSAAKASRGIVKSEVRPAEHLNILILLYKYWLGRKDSNLRMAESKSAALPLGYAPRRAGPYLRMRGRSIGRRCLMTSYPGCGRAWLIGIPARRAVSHFHMRPVPGSDAIVAVVRYLPSIRVTPDGPLAPIT